MRITDLFENTSMIQEITHLVGLLPTKWTDRDGREVWRIDPSRLPVILKDKSDDELAEWINSLSDTHEYLKANPSAILPDPFAPAFTPKTKKTLSILYQRVQRPFLEWLTTLLDEPSEIEQATKDVNLKLDYVMEYLRDEHSIEVRDDGLITFWGLTPAKERIIGDLPVVVYHFTASGVLPSIKKKGLQPDRKSVNDRRHDGIYVTTETSGNAVTGYIRNAVAVHGGHPICLTIKTSLSNLHMDHDDAGLESGRHQFVMTEVTPRMIVDVDEV